MTPPPGVVPLRPGPGQESVWDYPRPPALAATSELVLLEQGGVVVARSSACVRVLETSHPPVYYLPWDDIVPGVLLATPRTSYCEFKGVASYWTLEAAGRREVDVAWSYPHPSPGFEAITGMVSFYPGRLSRVTVDGELVRPQAGGFYGGWVTDRVVGPFKGTPGSQFW